MAASTHGYPSSGLPVRRAHGPGEEHVAIRRASERRPPGVIDPIVNPSQLTHERSSQICGRCHSVSMPLTPEDGNQTWQHGFRYRPGDDLNDTRFIVRSNQESIDHIRQFTSRFDTDELMSDYLGGSFWNDGEVRIAGREYNGISDSVCFQEGELSCLSCHELHQSPGESVVLSEWANDQLNADLTGDRACLQCHDHQQYESPTHTHHGGRILGESM